MLLILKCVEVEVVLLQCTFLSDRYAYFIFGPFEIAELAHIVSIGLVDLLYKDNVKK